MLNYIWLGLILLAVLLGGFNGLRGNPADLEAVVKGGFEYAEIAVMKLVLPLLGIWAVWLGLMRLAEKAGLVLLMARVLKPVMVRLFPDVPPEHPAMGSMLLNMAANMLGLTNAATPLGLRAMGDLEKLNPRPDTATNAMCTFLAVNTSSVQLIPITVIGYLIAAGATNPFIIVGTALMATLCSTIAGITAVKTLERLPWYRLPDPTAEQLQALKDRQTQPPDNPNPGATRVQPDTRPLPVWAQLVMALFLATFAVLFLMSVFPGLFSMAAPGLVSEAGEIPLFTRLVRTLSLLAIPFFFCVFPLFASLKGIKVYEEFVEGAKEAFPVAVRVIPFLVAILTAIGMFRAAGGIEILTRLLSPLLDPLGFPPELLPLALMRPLSGSGSLGLFQDMITAYGPNALVTMMGATLIGSTETTFYVITVYFGSVGVQRTRHAVPAGLFADLVGIIASVIVCRLVFLPPV